MKINNEQIKSKNSLKTSKARQRQEPKKYHKLVIYSHLQLIVNHFLTTSRPCIFRKCCYLQEV